MSIHTHTLSHTHIHTFSLSHSLSLLSQPLSHVNQAQDWTARMQAIEDPTVSYPDYYQRPFHAYEQGNLCWEAALEVTMAAK